MGFTTPKPIPTTPAPPPVRETGADVLAAQDAQRKKQAQRVSNAATINPTRGTLLTGGSAEPKRTLLGGP